VARNHSVYSFESPQGKSPSGSSKWARGLVWASMMVQSFLTLGGQQMVSGVLEFLPEFYSLRRDILPENRMDRFSAPCERSQSQEKP
jgi:hypothetical protein